MSSYLVFERKDVPGRKTPIVYVNSKSSGMQLGWIGWFARWRQFCFFPEPDTTFNVGCMQEIEAKIAELHKERR